MIPYIARILGNDIVVGFDRIGASPYTITKADAAIDAKTFALNMKTVVLGLNTMCKQNSSEFLLVYPLSMDYFTVREYCEACKEYNIAVLRAIASPSTIALLQPLNIDCNVFVIVQETEGFSMGIYENSSGLCETVMQRFYSNESNVIDFIRTWKFNVDKFVVIGSVKLNWSQIVDSLNKNISVDYNKSWDIHRGANILFRILNHENEDVLLLDIFRENINIILKDEGISCLIKQDSYIPCKRSETLTTSYDFQTRMAIVLDFYQQGANKGKRTKLLFINNIHPLPKGQTIFVIVIDIDASNNIEMTITNKGTGMSTTYKGVNSFPDMECQLNDIEGYLPAICSTKEELE